MGKKICGNGDRIRNGCFSTVLMVPVFDRENSWLYSCFYGPPHCLARLDNSSSCHQTPHTQDLCLSSSLYHSQARMRVGLGGLQPPPSSNTKAAHASTEAHTGRDRDIPSQVFGHEGLVTRNSSGLRMHCVRVWTESSPHFACNASHRSLVASCGHQQQCILHMQAHYNNNMHSTVMETE